MEAEYDSVEIARVIHGYKLIDSESYERCYSRRGGEPLLPGYYVATWPKDIKIRRFNEDAVFYGPFRRRNDAEAVLEQFRTAASGSFCVRREHGALPMPKGRLVPV